jgi:hypothetical protein
MRKGRDAGFSGGEEFLHREFGRGVQIHPPRRAVMGKGIGREGVQMRLVSRADLKGDGIDFGEALVCEPAAQGGLNAVAGKKKGAAVLMAVGVPPWGRGGMIVARGQGMPLSV